MELLYKPHLYAILALLGLVVGIGGLLMNAAIAAPVGLFVSIFCTIMAAIMITTPQASVVAARQRLVADLAADAPATVEHPPAAPSDAPVAVPPPASDADERQP